MLLKKWEDLPDFMKNDEVKVYYDILKNKYIYLLTKRAFDIIASLMILLITLPIFLFLIIWIKLDSKGPVFYCQERITQYGRVFKIYKFRTMNIDADKAGPLITEKDDNRITNIGMKIRKSRLDELPQLINVFMGEMSFVGTRPEVKKYVNCYSQEMLATLLLPAGVTSLASIHYRDEDKIIESFIVEGLGIDEIYKTKILPHKMIWNLEYLKKLSFFEDIKICLKTVI